MNEEIKDFFVRNGGNETEIDVHLSISDNAHLFLHNNNVFLYDELDSCFTIKEPSLDRVKALIYGLTGKNLD